MDCLWELEPDCITIDQFRQYFNVDSSEATQYVLDYFMTKYKCNQGYKDVMKHFYCIGEVGLYKTGDLIKCEKSLQSALGNNRGCADYNTYVTCLIDVFTKYCESGIKNYICNLKVNGIIDAIPDCKGQLQTCPDQGFKFHLPIGRLHKVQQAKRVLKTGHYIFP
ncbi:hypothetical protein FO519_008403 [Halicephalobus sp. NKZ332]|nr:hypothetical protein FO519_008403 [Halicephalobus sp. NKZ332]